MTEALDPMTLGPKYEKLRDQKERALEVLQKLKPGDKAYKGSLRQFLEIDADLERALLKRLKKMSGVGASAAEGIDSAAGRGG